jgi:abortive infection bacteriophage resistance protein
MSHLKVQQPPLTIEGQIENLREKGMIIEDEAFATSFLNDVSYFRLIKAFGLELKAQNGDFHENVRFEDIVQLYLFNSNLRQQLFTQIEKVEVNLRCRISNHFCCKYGVLGYEDVGNFAVPDTQFNRLLANIQNEVSRNSNSPFVKNFQTNYVDGKIPLYALVELFSFGTLSKYFKNMKNDDKKTIALQYGLSYRYLESWIESLASVRNICAHYGRLYNVKFTKSPMLYRQYIKDGISNYRVFATLLTLKHILPNDRHWLDFVETVELLVEKYPSVKLDLLGFPVNWMDYLT